MSLRVDIVESCMNFSCAGGARGGNFQNAGSLMDLESKVLKFFPNTFLAIIIVL